MLEKNAIYAKTTSPIDCTETYIVGLPDPIVCTEENLADSLNVEMLPVL